MIDPILLSQELIRCPSITPKDEGALVLLKERLETLGFTCHMLPFSEEGTETVQNLYARLGDSGPNICFAGHTDVVPVGDAEAWTHDPFAAEIEGGILYGRGAVDMKPAIAAWVAAVSRYVESDKPKGSISLLITGDEEGPAINGTKKVLEWLSAKKEQIDHCIVGEPTNPKALGDMIKIGRRGSVTVGITVHGTQGHVAYPHLADNPITTLISILHTLTNKVLDEGNEYFDPSNLEVVTIDVGNEVDNVIPAHATARCNIRFNDAHTAESLITYIKTCCDEVTKEYSLEAEGLADSFITEPGMLSEVTAAAVNKVTGRDPELSTSGGTSDARFIKDICPVVECGLINQTAHKVDESIAVADIEMLTSIYQEILQRYFQDAA